MENRITAHILPIRGREEYLHHDYYSSETPLQGELVVYLPDSFVGSPHNRPRIKIGDGNNTYKDLPFLEGGDWNEIDGKAAGFIRGKTHWYEKDGDNSTDIFPYTNLTFTQVDGNLFSDLSNNANFPNLLQNGELYTVYIDDYATDCYCRTELDNNIEATITSLRGTTNEGINFFIGAVSGPQLNMIHMIIDGTTDLTHSLQITRPTGTYYTKIPISYLPEATDGLQMDSFGRYGILIDPASDEGILSTSASGLKISGIQIGIDEAQNSANEAISIANEARQSIIQTNLTNVVNTENNTVHLENPTSGYEVALGGSAVSIDKNNTPIATFADTYSLLSGLFIKNTATGIAISVSNV